MAIKDVVVVVHLKMKVGVSSVFTLKIGFQVNYGFASKHCTKDIKQTIIYEAELYGYDRNDFVCVTGKSFDMKTLFSLIFFLGIFAL